MAQSHHAPRADVVWVCFALPEEARPFRRRLPRLPGTELILTGVGPAPTQARLQRCLAQRQPQCIWSCGLAGGLNPRWPVGTVLFATADPFWARRLRASGAIPARFCPTEHVVTTAAEKATLFHMTGADAVEMESGPVQTLCEAAGIPWVVVRAISDGATDDLPLDFQAFVRSDGSLDRRRLVANALARPRCWAPLIRLHLQTHRATRRLADVLEAALAGWQEALGTPAQPSGP